MEDSQTTIEMESRPDDNAQNSKPVSGVKTINNFITSRTYSADGRQPDDYRVADGASGS